MTLDLATVWVCEDCYFAHHYGVTIVGIMPDGHRVRIWWEEMPRLAFKGWRFEFYVGDSDTPADRIPLSRLDGPLYDNTCSNHYYGQPDDALEDGVPCEQCGRAGRENGIEEFSWRTCDGCGSTRGGSRYRLALFPQEES